MALDRLNKLINQIQIKQIYLLQSSKLQKLIKQSTLNYIPSVCLLNSHGCKKYFKNYY